MFKTVASAATGIFIFFQSSLLANPANYFGRDHLVVKAPRERVVELTLPELQNKDVIWEFKIRSQARTFSGWGNFAQITVNGLPITMKEILGKANTCPTRDGRTAPTVENNALLVYGAADFDTPMPSTLGYRPVDPHYDPFAYRLNITSLVEEGNNVIAIKNLFSGKETMDLILQDMALTLVPRPPAAKKAVSNGDIDNTKVFSLAARKTLGIAYKGSPLIVKDTIFGVNSLEDAERPVKTQKEGLTAINVIRRNDAKINFRKETVLTRNGLELTFKMDHASYTNLNRVYSFAIPFDVLKGAEYKAIIGRAYANKVVEGRIPDSFKGHIAYTPPNTTIQDTAIRFIAFKSPTVNLVFDFNPYGATQMYTDYPFSGEPLGVCSIHRDKDNMVFTLISRGAKNSGGLYAQKTLIYEGQFDFVERHPYQMWTYMGGPEPVAKYAFGSRIPKGFKRADCKVYLPGKKYGWDNADGLHTQEADPQNVFKNCVYSAEGTARTFSANVKPGCYFLTISCGHPTLPVGPFDVLIGDKVIASGITLPAGKNKTVIGSQYVLDRRPQVQVTFRGKSWAVNSLAIQVFIYQNEDYVITRRLWKVDGLYEPDIRLNVPPKQAMARTASGKKANGQDWVWKMRMANWVSEGHNATGFEFNTPDQVERRVKEIQSQGYNTINDGVYFWNLAYTHRWDKVVAMVRMIVEAAHRHGLKVVHHMDGPVPLYMGTGLEYLMQHPDFLQRDIAFNIPTLTRLCINNPDFRREIFSRLATLTRESGLDGFMIDECSFAGKDYCGCEHCRDLFEKEIGAVLPRDPNAPAFYNFDDPLWVRWIKWRQEAMADWWGSLKEILAAANPDVCFLSYSTEYGVYGSWASVEFGDDLPRLASEIDFVGTEEMPRNTFDAYRFEAVFRKVWRGIGDSYGKGTWGLVYHSLDKNIAYFGWALHHMNGQLPWMQLIEGEDMLRYLEWPGQMDCRVARPVSDVAIVYSSTTRDFLKSRNYTDFCTEFVGFSQILTDNHILHDFLLEQDLAVEKMSRYKLVILPAVSCMSRKQIAAIRRYVEAGGRVLATGDTSLQDENGVLQNNFLLSDLLGVQYVQGLLAGPMNIRFESEDRTWSYPNSCTRTSPLVGGGVQLLATAQIPGSEKSNPALTCRTVNKGLCFYLAAKLGSVNAEMEHTTGDKWTFTRNQDMADLLIKVVRRAMNDDFDVKAVQVPAKVLLNVFRQEENGNKFILVHLLNAGGAGDFKAGDIVPAGKQGDVFPAVPRDLVVDLRLGNLVDGYVISPDYKGKRPVDLTRQPNGYYRLTVKKSDLKAYSLVYLKTD